MRAVKYLVGLWTAVAVYSVVSLINGPAGLAAYSRLEAERERQLANMRALDALTEELENTQNSLLYDHETIAVYARRLGYARENERFVRIVGLGWTQNPYTAPGQVYFAGTPEYVSDKTIKIAALCAGLTAFIFFFALELLRNRKLTDTPPTPADF
jgi:cell division protein FtsB